MVVSLPLGDAARIRVEQGSIVFWGTGERVAAKVGSAWGVSVGGGVSVGVSVAGSGVEVGIAACVCATSVSATATAVFCTSTALIVGTAGVAPQALTKIPITNTIEITLTCFIFQPQQF